MAALALMNVLWACRVADRPRGRRVVHRGSAALVFVVATMVFAVGETLQGPTQAPLVVDLAPDRLRGRYFALSAMSWSAGGILGPLVGGALLGWHPYAVWPIAAGVCVVLRPRLPGPRAAVARRCAAHAEARARRR